MTTATASTDPQHVDFSGPNTPPPNTPEPAATSLTKQAWVKIAILAGLMAAVFWPTLRHLWLKTNPFSGEANWGHAMLVPVIGIYFLYTNRERLLATPVSRSWSGLGILLVGLGIFAYGIYPGQNDFIRNFGMIVALFGLVLLLCGWQVMRVAWFPIVFLVCSLPWPGLVYDKIAWPLQKLAAEGSTATLQLTGVRAERHETKIVMYRPDGLTTRTLNVAEACAGLRSLMTFIALGAAMAFLSQRPMWQKLIMVASAVPIAVACNVMRVSGQGLLDYYWSEKWSEGFAHQFAGIVMLIPAFFLLMAVGEILDKLFIEEVDDKEKLRLAGLRKNDGVIRIPRPAASAPTETSR